MEAPGAARTGASSALGAFFLVLLVLVFVDPRTARFAPICPLHATTGFGRPGCGTGRALFCLCPLGLPAGAVRLNALAVAAIPIFLALALQAAIHPEKRLPVPPLRPRLLIYAVLFLFLVGRNLPFEPFASWAAEDRRGCPPAKREPGSRGPCELLAFLYARLERASLRPAVDLVRGAAAGPGPAPRRRPGRR